MWMILQQDQPDDFILATGESYTVREFVERAFERAGHRIRWTGEGTAEKGIDKVSGRVFVEVDKRYFRPTEVDTLLGDPSKACAKLGWRPRTSFDQLVNEMVDKDLELMARDGNRWKQYE
jgi:GDPmannose 4,6-dehydratase